MLKNRKVITGDGSIPVVPFTRPLPVTVTIGCLTCRIRMAIIYRVCDIIRILGFTDTGITVTHPIIEAIILIQTSTDGTIAEVDMCHFHGGRTKKVICGWKISVLGVHAA